MKVEKMVHSEPMPFSKLVKSENLFLFSAAAAALDFVSFPDSPDPFPPESDEDEGHGTSSKKHRRGSSSSGSPSPSFGSSLGAVLFFLLGKNF